MADESIAYYGYFSSALGLGQAARAYVEALASIGITPSLVDLAEYVDSPQIDSGLAFSKPTHVKPRISILHVTPEGITPRLVHERVLTPSDVSFRIAAWAWESDDLPDEWAAYESMFDEIWALSEFTAEAIRRKVSIPVVTIPIPVHVPSVQADRRVFNLPSDHFTFLFTFDWNSRALRKNPWRVIEAFRKSFDEDEPVALVLKTINSRLYPEEFSRLEEAARGANITVIDRALSSDERFQLLASCDAYVSLHRAEGFGLGMAEAMAMGKPVVATGWSGNLQFMSEENSYLVDYDLQPLAEQVGPYPPGTLWAVPSVEDAAAKMRAVYDHPLEARLRAERGRTSVNSLLDNQSIGLLMKARLDDVKRGPSTPRRIAPFVKESGIRIEKMSAQLFRMVYSRPLLVIKLAPTILRIYRQEGFPGLRRALANRLIREEVGEGARGNEK